MHLAAGALDRLVRIAKPPAEADRTQSPTGAPDVTPVTLRDRVPAQRVDADGREIAQMQGTAGVVMARFRIRWLSSIDVTCVVYDYADGERAFAVQSVRELGRREGLELLCSARAE